MDNLDIQIFISRNYFNGIDSPDTEQTEDAKSGRKMTLFN